MDSDSFLLQQARRLVEAMDQVADECMPHEIAKIVEFHSKGAAIAALASGWIPGVGGVTAAATSGGFIWTMYGRIGKKIGLPFGNNVLKSLASGVATNLAVYVVGAVALSTAFSLFPALGNIGSSVIMGAACYALTLASGYVYLKIMTKLFSGKVDFSTVSEQELKDMAYSMSQGSDIKQVIKEAKSDFRKKRKKGEFKDP